jgi:holo-[acyl-carrier protein] synthase
MITGIGVDLVSVPRFAAFLRRHGERGLRRLFTRAEADYCLALADPVPSLAARFAAKEALFKALGTGFAGTGGWHAVEVVRSAAGAPALRLRGAALAAAGPAALHLSLSHTTEMAAAFVVVERRA